MKKYILIICWFYFCSAALARPAHLTNVFNLAEADSTVTEKVSPEKSMVPASRKWVAGGLTVAGLSGSLLLLTKSNNYQYDRNFKTINDGKAWLQIDKTEHFFLAYTTARFITSLGKWAGYSTTKAVLLGSTGSLLFLTTKEYLDGHHSSWGWSWTDMSANVFGTGLFATQELYWQEQKIGLKFSALPRKYEPDLDARADELFGHRVPERLLKDYNAQTYWLSFNINALTGNSNIPGWLNLAMGYGGDNLYGPYENIGFSNNGQIGFNRTDLPRYRQWYLSPDINFTKIKTRSRALKTIFIALNAVKVPLPTLAVSNQKLKGFWLHF